MSFLELLPASRLRDETSIYEVQELQSQHREICRMKATGMRDTDIANALGITVLSVQNTTRGALGRDYIENLERDADEETVNIKRRITDTAKAAIELLHSVVANGYVENADGETQHATLGQRMEAGLKALHMDGHAPVTKIEARVDENYAARAGMSRIAKRMSILRDRNIIDLKPAGPPSPEAVQNG